MGDSLERRQFDMWLLANYECRAPPVPSHDTHRSEMNLSGLDFWHRCVSANHTLLCYPFFQAANWGYGFGGAFIYFLCVYVGLRNRADHCTKLKIILIIVCDVNHCRYILDSSNYRIRCQILFPVLCGCIGNDCSSNNQSQQGNTGRSRRSLLNSPKKLCVSNRPDLSSIAVRM